MPLIRRSSLHSIARRAMCIALAGGCVASGSPVHADDALEPEKGAYALDYDFGFMTRPGSSPPMLERAAQPAAFTGERMLRTLVVDGVEYGAGETGVANDTLFLASNLASVAGLDCGDIRMAGDVSLCAVGTRNFWTEGDRLFVNSGGGASTLEVKAAPELTPTTAAFINYDMNFVSNPDGSAAAFGTIHPALRLKEHAIDVDISVFKSLDSGEQSSGAHGRISISSFAYRREWFEKRLRLVAGRTQSNVHGLGGGDRFDGVSLERFNSDEVGSVPTAGVRPISGFATGPGILQYRLGDKVYKQIPVREGKYEVGGEFLADLPRGGRLEFVGLDGLAREVSMPSDVAVQYAFYRPGDFSFDLHAGRLDATGGDRPYAGAGGRYGVSRDVTAELAVATTDRAFSVSGSVNWRMPGALGVIALSGATTREWSGGDDKAASVEANYFNRFGEVSLDLMHRRNFNGGYHGLGFTSNARAVTDLAETSRATVGFRVPFPGDDVSVRLVAERSRYSGFSSENRLVQLDLGRSFGRLGSGVLLGRFGRDQYGKGYSSVMVNWTVPLGRRHGVTANFTTNKGEGQSRDNRYSATLWGSTAGAYGIGANYQFSVDQDERLAADGSWRTRLGTIAGSLSRNPGERPFGSVGMRGALVFAGGAFTATRQLSDSLLVLRSKALGGSQVFVPPDMEGRTRFTGNGYGVITDLAPYRQFNLAFDESNLPLGMEISRDSLTGSLRPYRAYLVDIPVAQLQPLRLYADIPVQAYGNGNAIAGDSFAPIEMDGSIYFNGWPTVPVVLTWATEQGLRSCSIVLSAPPAPPSDAESAFAIVELRGVACNPQEKP